jgi:hypothetical protein
MQIIQDKDNGPDSIQTLLVRGKDEDIMAFEATGFYKVGQFIVPGHHLHSMQRVAWDVEAQEWKVVR